MSQLSARLLSFNAGLIPDMAQLKYKFMSESAFRFFRGTCHLFYEDLAKVKNFPVSPPTWVCGDLHLENFGSFKGNNRMVYFDLNDFDESALAPLAWEISRVVTSIFVAFNTLKIKPAEAKKAAKLFLKTYGDVLSAGKAYYIDPRTATGLVKHFVKAVKNRKEHDLIQHVARSKASNKKIAIDNKTHFKIAKDLKSALIKRVSTWIKHTSEWPNNYTVKDAAFRVAGTGSVGLNRYMFLLQSTKNKNKFVLVEMKEGRASCLTPYNGIVQPVWKSEPERIIFIKQRMQNISPALLSEIYFQGKTYVFNEMQPAADKIKFELIRENYAGVENVIKDMAMLAASAQLRSGGIKGSSIIDDLVTFGKQNKWQDAVFNYAIKYSKQVSQDYLQFMNDFTKGEFSTLQKQKHIKPVLQTDKQDAIV